MAGDAWELDVIFHSLLITGKSVPSLWSSWSTEFLLAVSFGMQFLLTILAGFRCRGSSSKLWDAAVGDVIWLCYVGSDYVATTAVSSLSVSSTAGDRQLLAFWAPFFLLHLGGPDNITAYELEDNKLSACSVLVLVFRVFGASYVVYKSISGSRTLVAAAWLMLAVGVAKYVEKILALHRANLGSIRSSVKSQHQRRTHQAARDGRRYRNNMLRGDTESDKNGLLMVADSMFHICKRAMVDSSVEMESAEAQEKKEILLEMEWDAKFEVMEMELSLMYDFLYTKAAVIYTWHCQPPIFSPTGDRV